jgi:hypothetical protein
VIRTREGDREARLVFGSCRVGAPERPPYSLSRAEHEEGLEVDALWAYSRRLQQGEVPWPDALLLLGDQVYADLVPPETAAFIRSRRDVGEPPARRSPTSRSTPASIASHGRTLISAGCCRRCRAR